MAKQVINIGNNANDGSGDPLRTAFDKVNDNFTELYDETLSIRGDMVTAADLVRADGVVAANGAADQVIAFSSEFVTNYSLVLQDYNGLGIAVTAKTATGFTITSLSAGNFGYIAIIEV